MGEDLVLYKDQQRQLRPGRPALPAPPRGPVLRLGRGVRPALQLPRLEVRRDRRVHRPAVRGDRPPGRALQGPHQHQGLPGRGAAPGCCGPTWARSRRRWCRTGSRSPGATASSRSSSPRSRATGSSARRTPSTRSTSSGCTTTGAQRLRGQTNGKQPPTHLRVGFDEFEYGFTYRAYSRGPVRAGRAVDGRPRVPVAELPVHRQPLRVARADRRRQHAQRRLVLRPRARGDGAVPPGAHSVLVRADQGRADRAAGSTRTS